MVLADRGYFEGDEILACEAGRRHAARAQAADLKQPRPTAASTSRTSSTARSRTTTAARPAQICSGRFNRVDEKGKTLHQYWTSALPGLPAQAPVHARPS